MGTPCPRKLHRRGFYGRYRTADSAHHDAVVDCYRCPLSGRTFSVVPEGMMPYRPLPAEQAASYADQQALGELPRDCQTREPVIAGSAAQRRSWQSFWAAFNVHAVILASLSGTDLASKPAAVWKALRHPGPDHTRRPASAILGSLHGHQTSLAKSYLSLRPWWEGGLARGP
jgi:hypothetical protein